MPCLEPAEARSDLLGDESAALDTHPETWRHGEQVRRRTGGHPLVRAIPGWRASWSRCAAVVGSCAGPMARSAAGWRSRSRSREPIPILSDPASRTREPIPIPIPITYPDLLEVDPATPSPGLRSPAATGAPAPAPPAKAPPTPWPPSPSPRWGEGSGEKPKTGAAPGHSPAYQAFHLPRPPIWSGRAGSRAHSPRSPSIGTTSSATSRASRRCPSGSGCPWSTKSTSFMLGFCRNRS